MDRNWLNIYNIVASKVGKLQTIDPSLTTFEVQQLINWFDFSKAKIKGVYLDKMVTEEFTNKYKIEHRFGIKIGIGIY